MCAKGHRRRGIVARRTPARMPSGCTQTSGAGELEKGLPLLLTHPVMQEGLAGKRGTQQSFPALPAEVDVADFRLPREELSINLTTNGYLAWSDPNFNSRNNRRRFPGVPIFAT